MLFSILANNFWNVLQLLQAVSVDFNFLVFIQDAISNWIESSYIAACEY